MFNKHEGTLGHAIGASIISDKGSSSPSTHPEEDGAPKFGRIQIEDCPGGGCTVEHTPAATPSQMSKKDSSPGMVDVYGGLDHSKTMKTAHSNAADAHVHVSKLMGHNGVKA